MSNASIGGLVLLVLFVFWGVGAHNRLSAARDRLVRRYADADRVLRIRRKAVLAWVAAVHESPATSGGDAVLHACAQAEAAGDKARAKPTARGLIGSLNMAEQVMERTLRDFMQQPATASAVGRRAAWVATEVQLSVVRLAFNREVASYNTAVQQFPARLIAALIRLSPTGPLEAGAELSAAAAQSPATLVQVPVDAAGLVNPAPGPITAGAAAPAAAGAGIAMAALGVDGTPDPAPVDVPPGALRVVAERTSTATGGDPAHPYPDPAITTTAAGPALGGSPLDPTVLANADDEPVPPMERTVRLPVGDDTSPPDALDSILPMGLSTAVLEGTMERIAVATTPGALDPTPFARPDFPAVAKDSGG